MLKQAFLIKLNGILTETDKKEKVFQQGCEVQKEDWR